MIQFNCYSAVSTMTFQRINSRVIPNISRYFQRNYADKKYDLAIIGGGIAGIYAALRAAQQKIKRIILLEKDTAIGGLCIRDGCTPSKFLLNHTNHFYQLICGSYQKAGITGTDIKCDLNKMMNTKCKMIEKQSESYAKRLKSNNIEILYGTATLAGCKQIKVDGNDCKTYSIEADRIIIATGSTARCTPGTEIDEKYIVTSFGAMKLRTVPPRLSVYGAGYVGLEMATIWTRLGSKVTVISPTSWIVSSTLDEEIMYAYKKTLQNIGIDFVMNTKVLSTKKIGNVVQYIVEDLCQKKRGFECDVFLVAIGRDPATSDLNLEKIGMQMNPNGSIWVNEYFETNVPNIYAVGDVIPGPMIANRAIEDGIRCVDGMFLKTPPYKMSNMPMVIYTYPELASVGQSEEMLKRMGHSYTVKKIMMDDCCRAYSNADFSGIIKSLICNKSGGILGTHIISPNASEVIHEAILAQQFGIAPKKVFKMIHAHPSYAELLKEICK